MGLLLVKFSRIFFETRLTGFVTKPVPTFEFRRIIQKKSPDKREILFGSIRGFEPFYALIYFRQDETNH